MSEKRFPMQDGPDIDWTTAEKIYVEYSSLFGKGQTLERLAARGGFGWSEVSKIRKKYQQQQRAGTVTFWNGKSE